MGVLEILQENGYILKPKADKTLLQLNIGNFDIQQMQQLLHPYGRSTPTVALKDLGLKVTQQKLSGLKDQATAAGIQALSSILIDKMTNGMFGDSYIGLNLANIFSLGVSSAGNTMTNNIIKGLALTQGLGKNVGQSVSGTAVGLTSNLIGQGINSLGGDTRLSRGIGLGVATGLANTSGIVNGIKTLSTTGKALNEAKTAFLAASSASDLGGMAKSATNMANLKKLSNVTKWNLAGIGGQVLGSALGAATGPSKEYGGKYGNVTLTADMIYDLGTATVGLVPGGLVLSGALALNKGLSNIFGSTDGMTVQDAILGSAFMPAPIKWLNMAGANTTDKFEKLSWLNLEMANNFMGNAFGDLDDKFDRARRESEKTYGLFSLGAYKDALKNINFANTAWNQILDMAAQNKYLNIRSFDMSSINNLRYALNILGGWKKALSGKLGMKILNNATNHNIGMRLLSGAALIDNKQMILCSVVD